MVIANEYIKTPTANENRNRFFSKLYSFTTKFEKAKPKETDPIIQDTLYTLIGTTVIYDCFIHSVKYR
jgi:hypothetical protein